MVKMFFLISNLDLSCCNLCHLTLTPCHIPLQKVLLNLLDKLLIGVNVSRDTSPSVLALIIFMRSRTQLAFFAARACSGPVQQSCSPACPSSTCIIVSTSSLPGVGFCVCPSCISLSSCWHFSSSLLRSLWLAALSLVSPQFCVIWKLDQDAIWSIVKYRPCTGTCLELHLWSYRWPKLT